MNIKKITLGLIAFTLLAPVILTGCYERVETERIEVQDVDPAPVVVPDRGDVDVNVHTDSQPVPNVIHKDTSTNTTIERNNDTGVTTETKTETKTGY